MKKENWQGQEVTNGIAQSAGNFGTGTIRTDRKIEIIRDLAARFLNEQGSGVSLLTVTGVEMSKDEKNATILFTVFPETLEKTALEFAKRKRSEFKSFVRENSTLGRIPFFDFRIDLGEKNRQKIDGLLNQK
jgi:ribosome-binding factor A